MSDDEPMRPHKDGRSVAQAAPEQIPIETQDELRMRYLRYVVLLLLLGVSFSCGLAVGLYQIFPFDQIRAARDFVAPSLKAKKPRVTLFDYFAPEREIVMIGDSLTEGGIWSEIFPNASIANRGVAGDTTADILRRMDTIFNVSPKKAFVMAGINDFYTGWSVDEVFSRYEQIVSRLKARNIAVVIQSTLECAASKCLQIVQSVRALNAKLRSYAAQQQILFLDINDGLTSQEEGLLARYSDDGVHLLGEGYAVWAKHLSKHMTIVGGVPR